MSEEQPILTLDDFNKKIMEPAIQAMEKRLGKTRKEIVADCDRQLAPHRRLMARIRKNFLKD